MRAPRLIPFLLALAAIPSLADAALGQQDPVGGQPLDPYYRDQADQEERDQRREEDRARDEQTLCASGCDDYDGGLQSRTIPNSPFVAVVHQATVDDEVLTLRIRFYNGGNEPAELAFDPVYDSTFVSIGGEKLFILRDDDGELDAKEPLDETVQAGEMESWWARFPAPPAGTTSFDLDIPPIEPFRNVPLGDD
jgi:hypothetical protein